MKNKSISTTTAPKRIKAMDIVVGRRVREIRLLMNMSQNELGNRLNLTFQQIQKYERGLSRISAATLYSLAQIFGCPVTWFFGEDGNDNCNPFTSAELGLIQKYRHLSPSAQQALIILLQQSGTSTNTHPEITYSS